MLATSLYALHGGVVWRLLPNDLSPKSTAVRWFALQRDSGLFGTINHLHVMTDRERVVRDASPIAAVGDEPERDDYPEQRFLKLDITMSELRARPMAAQRSMRRQPPCRTGCAGAGSRMEQALMVSERERTDMASAHRN